MINKYTTYGHLATPRAKLTAVFNDVKFGAVTLLIVDGTLAPVPEIKIRYSRKPRSHLGVNKRDSTDKPQASQADVIRDLLEDISPLQGSWEVIIQIANSIPIKWDFEEIGPLQYPNQN